MLSRIIELSLRHRGAVIAVWLVVAIAGILSFRTLPLDALGALLVTNTSGYMLASALSGRLMAALNTGTLLAGCCALAGLTLLATAPRHIAEALS